MTFSQRLLHMMTIRGVTQKELSERTGIGKSSISQYLAGKNIPGNRYMDKICDVLDCNPCDLQNYMYEEDKEPKNVTIKQAAFRLGKSEQFVRVGLQRGALPFGSAVKISGTKYSYHISPNRLAEYLGE